MRDRVGAFESLIVRRRPPPPPPPIRTSARRPPPPPPPVLPATLSGRVRSRRDARLGPNDPFAAGGASVNGPDVDGHASNRSRSSSGSSMLSDQSSLDEIFSTVNLEPTQSEVPLPQRSSSSDVPQPVPASMPPTSRSEPSVSGASSSTIVVPPPAGEGDETPPAHEEQTLEQPSDSVTARRQQSFEYTDLDLLVARLESPTASAQGASYDDLLIISDVIGPAQTDRSRRNVQAVEDLPVAPILVERRRVTKDGRKKLKLSLMGILVDRCSVCMSQFKQENLGVLLPCHHS